MSFEPLGRISRGSTDLEAGILPVSLGFVDICGDREVPVIVRWVELLLRAKDAVELLLLEIVALLVLAAVDDLLSSTARAKGHQLLQVVHLLYLRLLLFHLKISFYF